LHDLPQHIIHNALPSFSRLRYFGSCIVSSSPSQKTCAKLIYCAYICTNRLNSRSSLSKTLDNQNSTGISTPFFELSTANKDSVTCVHVVSSSIQHISRSDPRVFSIQDDLCYLLYDQLDNNSDKIHFKENDVLYWQCQYVS
jgi:hypothetical protein